MKKTILTTCLFVLTLCILSGCSAQLENKMPADTVATIPTTTHPIMHSTTSPTQPNNTLTKIATINAFVDNFNKLAPDGCQFANYTINQEGENYIISTQDEYSALIRLAPSGEVASFFVRNGSFYQKISAAKTIIRMLYPENEIPKEKADEMEQIKRQVFEVKTQIQKQIQENKDIALDDDGFAFSDLSQQAEEILLQIENMRDQLE